MIAETVTIPTQSTGRIPPIAFPIISARILTAIVQLPSNFTGIINRTIPTIDGTRNFAMRLLLFFSI